MFGRIENVARKIENFHMINATIMASCNQAIAIARKTAITGGGNVRL
jgi:hypothetical protein